MLAIAAQVVRHGSVAFGAVGGGAPRPRRRGVHPRAREPVVDVPMVGSVMRADVEGVVRGRGVRLGRDRQPPGSRHRRLPEQGNREDCDRARDQT